MRFLKRRIITLLCSTGILGLSPAVYASAFQIWEQDGASVGDYHAGYAAQANDASTSFYNPAGITRFDNPQVVVGAVGVKPNFKFRGNILVSTLSIDPMQANADGGIFTFVPDVSFVAPINERIGFGFSVVVPFGLKTDYGLDSTIRYAATLSSIQVIDVSPALAFKITDQASFGVGFDIQKVNATFDSVAGAIAPQFDTKSLNRADDTGYGYHAGLLYEFTPETRVGLSYHSQVVHKLTGTSKFLGPLATNFNGGEPIKSHAARTSFTLPAFTALGFYHKAMPQLAVMGTVIYTQWNVFKTLSLRNVAGLDGLAPSKSLVVTLDQDYRNTWSVSLGAEYYVNPCVTLRGGIGFDQSPVSNENRDVRLPDNDRYVFALGGHYQASKSLGLDAGWTHLMMRKVSVHPKPLVAGTEEITVNGHVSGSANVVGVQVTYDFV